MCILCICNYLQFTSLIAGGQPTSATKCMPTNNQECTMQCVWWIEIFSKIEKTSEGKDKGPISQVSFLQRLHRTHVLTVHTKKVPTMALCTVYTVKKHSLACCVIQT